MGGQFVIVGGDAAGMSAASKAKRDDPDRDVLVLERGDWVAFGACGLPYYIQGEIATLEELEVMEPRRIIEERGIDLRRHHEVVSIDRADQAVTVAGEDGRYEEPYDELLLATGGRARLPAVPGADLEGIFSVRSLEAGQALKHYISHHEASPTRGRQAAHPADVGTHLDQEAVEVVGIVGAHKIGLELAEAFVERGLEVRVFDSRPRVLPLFGKEVGEMVEDHLRDAGVTLHLMTTVEEFLGEDGRVTAVETDEKTVAVDAVVADVGVEPRVDLAAAAGIELGSTGAIATDRFGRTNDPAVYAAGDCAEKRDRLSGELVLWPFGLAANRAGRAVGRTVAGRPTPVGEIVRTLVMKALDLQVARTGIVAHDEARDAGFDPTSALITSVTRAHYYPGWSRMVVHATADRDTGRLLGANMVATEGTAHRINSVATAIAANMTVEEVGGLDFGYAPPFGPVWDPVLGVAKVLEEKLERETGRPPADR